MDEATARPWRWPVGGGIATTDQRHSIVSWDGRSADARLVVEAVNAYDRLRAIERVAIETEKVLNIMLERQTLTGAATARDWLRAALEVPSDAR